MKTAIWIVLCAAVLTACPAWPDPLEGTAKPPAPSTAADPPPATPPATPNTVPPNTVPSNTPTLGTPTPTPTPPTPNPPTPNPPASPRPRWVPAPGTSWQWQLTTPIDTSVDVQVYDIDGFEATPEVVRELHSKGRKVICYINTGASETFRPDNGAFPPEIQGKPDGFDGERWLDIRRFDVLRPIMARRFDMCQQKGFDAVEADLADGYDNDTGFPLTARDQLTYNRMLAGLAHERGMSIALKNDLDQVTELLDEFDFAVNEQCAQYRECEKLIPFIRANKAVFHVEYELEVTQFCPATRALGFSSMRKQLALDATRQPC